MPPNFSPITLSILVSFAVGGLLGDVFLHLLPQTFLGEIPEEGVKFVLVDERRNTLLGLAIFFGFTFFVVLDKTMRVLNGNEESHSHSPSHSHSHSHSHSQSQSHSSNNLAIATARQEGKSENLRKRLSKNSSKEKVPEEEVKESKEVASSARLSAYLNVMADFSHNVTDGLALSATFYASKNAGAVACLAVCLHEIPHQVGDFALLIKGGFTKSRALKAQLVTCSGAYLGTLLGIVMNHFSGNTPDNIRSDYSGLFGTNVTIGDLTLPFSAGAFLYIATIGVIPEILESGQELSGGYDRAKQAIIQFIAMIAGIGVMFVITAD